MRNQLFFISLLLAGMMAVNSCRNKSPEVTPVDPQPETPLFTDGQIVNSDFYVDDVLREQMIDTVVNLGSKNNVALFFVNQKHTLDGAPLAKGNDHSNIFRSLTRKELFDFIVLWGRINGMTINIQDTSAGATAKRQEAFILLQSFLIRNRIDLPLLVALSQNTQELGSAINWVNAAGDLTRSGIKLARENTPGHIFRALEIAGGSPSELSKAVRSAGMTERDFLLLSQEKGVNLSQMLKQGNAPEQVAIIVTLVCKGIKWFTILTVHLISWGMPDPDLQDSYVSYLNDADSNVMNYISRKETVSPTYKVAYCTLATAEFYIETYYDAYHKTLAGKYVNRSGMVVKSVNC